MEENVMNLFTSFINLMKSNGKSFDYIMNSIKESDRGEAFYERCHFLIYEVIKPLYKEYERSLRESGQMDFTDVIIRATELCNSGKWKSNLWTRVLMTTRFCAGQEGDISFHFCFSNRACEGMVLP